MSIVIVEAPTRSASGRRPRLSDEDIQNLADAVRSGQWASDEEPPVNTKSAAYQRAQAAVALMADTHDVTAMTAVRPVEVTVDGKTVIKFDWRVGPKPASTTQTPVPAAA